MDSDAHQADTAQGRDHLRDDALATGRDLPPGNPSNGGPAQGLPSDRTTAVNPLALGLSTGESRLNAEDFISDVANRDSRHGDGQHDPDDLLDGHDDLETGDADEEAHGDELHTAHRSGAAEGAHDTQDAPQAGDGSQTGPQPLRADSANGHIGPAFGPTLPGRDGWVIKEGTRQLYEQRVRRMWRAVAVAATPYDSTEEVEVTPMMVVNYLVSRSANGDPGMEPLREGSWNGYRSALLWDLARNALLPEYVAALRILEESRYFVANLPSRPVPQAKPNKRGILWSHLRQLVDRLGEMNREPHRWGERTQWWLLAGIASGVRCSEWEHARWGDAEKTWLLAPTIKEKADVPASMRKKLLAESGTGTAPQARNIPQRLTMRTIPIDPADRYMVDLHMTSIAMALGNGMAFTHYYDSCRNPLWRACKILWGDEVRYGLSNGRNQFAANKKKVSPPEEVARLMGHSNTGTSAWHYASPRAAYKKAGGLRQKEAAAAQQSIEGQAAPTAAPAQPAGPQGNAPIA